MLCVLFHAGGRAETEGEGDGLLELPLLWQQRWRLSLFLFHFSKDAGLSLSAENEEKGSQKFEAEV